MGSTINPITLTLNAQALMFRYADVNYQLRRPDVLANKASEDQNGRQVEILHKPQAVRPDKTRVKGSCRNEVCSQFRFHTVLHVPLITLDMLSVVNTCLAALRRMSLYRRRVGLTSLLWALRPPTPRPPYPRTGPHEVLRPTSRIHGVTSSNRQLNPRPRT